jgi:hypothetical protein
MKISFKLASAVFNFLLVTATANAALNEPLEKVFNNVRQQATKLGYNSYSTIVCLRSNGKIALGGATGWPFGTEIYLVDSAGHITETKRVSPRDEDTSLLFKVDNTEVSLTLFMPSVMGNYLKQEALLTVGSTEGAENLTCFTEVSGLE